MTNFLIIKDEFHGKRIEKFLKSKFPNISNREWKIKLEKKDILLEEGKPVSWGDRFPQGTRIKVLTLPPQKGQWLPAPNEEKQIPIIYENKYWLALDKPSQIHSLPLSSLDNDNVASCLHALRPNLVTRANPAREAGIVNRLDYFTSGILLAGKDPQISIKLRGSFSNHHLEKDYYALVEGKLSKRVWLTGKVGGIDKDKTAFTPGNEGKGKRAVSVIEPLATRKELTLVKVTTKYGCRHQVRVQLQYLGNPILGDLKYGGRPLNWRGFFLWARRLSVPENPHIKRCLKIEVLSKHLPAPWLEFIHEQNLEEFFRGVKAF